MQGALELAARGVVERPVVTARHRRRVGLGGLSSQQLLELFANADTQLLRRFLREGDDEHLIERDVGVEHELDDEVLEREGLARSCRGLDDCVTIECNGPHERWASCAACWATSCPTSTTGTS